MTGTAETEAAEFATTYGIPVVPIPTNVPMVRADQPDLIYKSEDAKFAAVVDDIVERYETGQPVLVGTASVAKSEQLSRLLERRGIPHQVLNAKQHAREAEIVAQAGRLHAVTVATNMAGRGVDILLGGNPEGLARREVVAQGSDLDSRRGHDRVREPAGPLREGVRRGGRRDPRARRALRARQRAPREPAHRQPAPGPLGPPGRPRREPVLPVARGRAHAPLRHRRHAVGDGPDPARRRADRGQDGDQGHRARPEHRRGPQRRDPQGRPQVRRGPERAAQGDLRPPHAGHRRRGPARAHRGAARGDHRRAGALGLSRRVPRGRGTSSSCWPR